jgi:hypothetical protein
VKSHKSHLCRMALLELAITGIPSLLSISTVSRLELMGKQVVTGLLPEPSIDMSAVHSGIGGQDNQAKYSHPEFFETSLEDWKNSFNHISDFRNSEHREIGEIPWC